MSTPDNRGAPVLTLLHSSLVRSDDGMFKSRCPVCDEGVLLVRRSPGTLSLSAQDNCVLCGQSVVYLDAEIGGEPLPWSPAVRAEPLMGKDHAAVVSARKILIDGLKYHEHDGHTLPKKVVRDALAALGVPEEDQP